MDYRIKALTNIRTSAPGGEYRDIGDLLVGDVITGVKTIINTYPWIKFTKWTRNGQALPLPISLTGEYWAYGVNTEEIVTPPPPPTTQSIFVSHTFNDTMTVNGVTYTATFTVPNVEYKPNP